MKHATAAGVPHREQPDTRRRDSNQEFKQDMHMHTKDQQAKPAILHYMTKACTSTKVDYDWAQWENNEHRWSQARRSNHPLASAGHISTRHWYEFEVCKPFGGPAEAKYHLAARVAITFGPHSKVAPQFS